MPHSGEATYFLNTDYLDVDSQSKLLIPILAYLTQHPIPTPNEITGTLTPGYIPVATGPNTIGDSLLEQNSGSVVLYKTTQTANASVRGFTLDNGTAATAGNQQYSPEIILGGRGWSTGGAGNTVINFKTEVIPVEGANATGRLAISSSVGGGAYGEKFSCKMEIPMHELTVAKTYGC